VRSLALVAPVGLGEEIDGAFIRGFHEIDNRRELKPLLQRLFADPELVTRSLVADVLAYKRIDGVTDALRGLADSFTDGDRQTVTAPLDDSDVPLLVVSVGNLRERAQRRPEEGDWSGRRVLHVLMSLGRRRAVLVAVEAGPGMK
jgi:hypothetical protein